jgi:hypothetical protein
MVPTRMAAHAPPIRTPQIILGALASGVVIFTGIVVFLRLEGVPLENPRVARLLPLFVILLAACELPVYLLLRRAFVAQVRAAREESLELVKQGKVPLQLQTLAILGAALAEGVGLLGVITVLLGGSWFVLAAPAVSVVLIVAQMPTRERLERVVRGGLP